MKKPVTTKSLHFKNVRADGLQAAFTFLSTRSKCLQWLHLLGKSMNYFYYTDFPLQVLCLIGVEQWCHGSLLCGYRATFSSHGIHKARNFCYQWGMCGHMRLLRKQHSNALTFPQKCKTKWEAKGGKTIQRWGICVYSSKLCQRLWVRMRHPQFYIADLLSQH